MTWLRYLLRPRWYKTSYYTLQQAGKKNDGGIMLKPSICKECKTGLMSNNGLRQRCGAKEDYGTCNNIHHVRKEHERRLSSVRIRVCKTPGCYVMIESHNEKKKYCGNKKKGCVHKRSIERRAGEYEENKAFSKKNKIIANNSKPKMKKIKRRMVTPEEENTLRYMEAMGF